MPLREPREVTTKQGQEFAARHQLMGFRETSAKTGLSVEQTFNDFATALFQRKQERKELDIRTPLRSTEVRTVTVKKQAKGNANKKCKC